MSTTSTPDPITARVLADAPRPHVATPGEVPAAKRQRGASTKPRATKRAPAKPRPAAKPKAAPKPKAKASKRNYPEWLPAAVARGRVLSGKKVNPKTGAPHGDKTLSYAGPRQHMFARDAITRHLGGTVTADALLAASGMKSVKALREVAEWSAPREALKPMRELSRVADDGTGWSVGRYCAAIVLAWHEELRAAERAKA